MKKILVILQVCVFSFAIVSAQSQTEKTNEIKIKTTAQCSMCKERIETAMAFEKGVKSSSLDIETKVLTVVYKYSKTNPEKIRIAVTKLGYDADDMKKNEKAYSALPGCCKLPEDPGHAKH